MSGAGTNSANPVPAGLISFGLACLIFCALLNGLITPEGFGVVGLWLIAGFFVQVIVGVIEIRLGSSVGGNTFLWFSAYFMLATGSVYLMEYVAHSLGWKVDPRIEGYCWVGITFVMWLLYPSFLKTMPLMVGLLITIMNIGAPLITCLKLGLIPKTLAPFVGDSVGIAGLLALYSAACMINNTVYGKAILPFPGPVIKS